MLYLRSNPVDDGVGDLAGGSGDENSGGRGVAGGGHRSGSKRLDSPHGLGEFVEHFVECSLVRRVC